MIYIMGMGAGGYRGLTIEESEIISWAECLLGAKRLLDNIPDDKIKGEKKSITRASEIVSCIEEQMAISVFFFPVTRVSIQAQTV